jgi:hypothetical protein
MFAESQRFNPLDANALPAVPPQSNQRPAGRFWQSLKAHPSRSSRGSLANAALVCDVGHRMEFTSRDTITRADPAGLAVASG